jgi:2-polyprenyl-3-methyl-5-hydroxy-6-metoxy-1,4-benzoquinol methylase
MVRGFPQNSASGIDMNFDKHPNVSAFYEALSHQFPYFAGVMHKQMEMFGTHWLDLFEVELRTFFCSATHRTDQAVRGYGKFSLDSMKLQAKFQKTRQYDNKTYAEAASEVYQNREYMFGLYLPGILLSHYLWRHHFLQHVYFLDKFLPLIGSGEGKVFYDIGVGTGFYSKEMLTRTKLNGMGFDLSPYSLEHTQLMLTAHGVAERYQTNLLDVVQTKVQPPADFLVNIEVLEHLEDPQSFIDALARMLKPGGHGLISAAINAPNADHIYLYRHSDEVAEQLCRGGFEIVSFVSDEAYLPRKPDELVPVNAAFIVTKK